MVPLFAKQREISVSSSHERGKNQRKQLHLEPFYVQQTPTDGTPQLSTLPASCPGWIPKRSTKQLLNKNRGSEEGRSAWRGKRPPRRQQQAGSMAHTQQPNPAHTAPPTPGTAPHLAWGPSARPTPGSPGTSCPLHLQKPGSGKGLMSVSAKTTSGHISQRCRRLHISAAGLHLSPLRSWNTGSQRGLCGAALRAAGSAVKAEAQTCLSWKEE